MTYSNFNAILIADGVLIFGRRLALLPEAMQKYNSINYQWMNNLKTDIFLNATLKTDTSSTQGKSDSLRFTLPNKKPRRIASPG